MTFAQKLREARHKAGITTYDLAKKLNFASNAVVCHYESGKHKPTLNSALKVSRLLGFSLDDIDLEPEVMGSLQEKEKRRKELKVKRLQHQLEEAKIKLADLEGAQNAAT